MRRMKDQMKVWELPWEGKMVPHAVLDILRGCNISCRSCYNTRPADKPKSLQQISEELDALLRLRRLSSVSILGGEVTLHPRLCAIIRMVRDRGLDMELVSNGLDVDRSLLKELTDAGLNIIYFHIERGQRRPDLPSDPSFEDINRLRREKAETAAEFGLDVGLSLTLYPGETEDLWHTLSCLLQSPQINYLLVTLFRDVTSIEALHGDLQNGISGEGGPPRPETRQEIRTPAAWMQDQFGLKPFAFVGSNLDRNDARWLSYLVGVVHKNDGGYSCLSMRPGVLERLSMLYYRFIKRCYPMYMEQNSDQFRKHLFLNGLLNGRLRQHSEVLNQAKQNSAELRAKRILLQNPAELTEDGSLLHCRCCPDAVIKNERLVPVCVADKIVP
ncbi:MAG: radical SAM protein [Candidatus Electrothrix sp. AR4]|nr:radical SAM protein [Candidatus Electrothrix sp. AR4]